MSVGRNPLVPAYVIHRRAYSDTSMIVDLLTPEQGRMSVLAKGVKSGKSLRALLLQPFRSLHVGWTGKSELPILTTAEEAGNGLYLQGEALACGYYINELVYHLVPKFEPAPDLFAHYWPTIESCADPAKRSAHLRYFEIALLEQLGLAPILTNDINSGNPIQRGSLYLYKIPEGPGIANNTSGGGIEISGDSLLNIASMDFSDDKTQTEAKMLTRSLLHYHLDGKKLMSRDLFKSFSALNEAKVGVDTDSVGKND